MSVSNILSIYLSILYILLELLICEDEILHDKNKSCDKRAKEDKSGCTDHIDTMMLACPKTCGLCSAVPDDGTLQLL